MGLILNAVLKTIGHSLVLCCYFYAPCRWLCWFRFRVFIFIETKEAENRFGTVKYVFFFKIFLYKKKFLFVDVTVGDMVHMDKTMLV